MDDPADADATPADRAVRSILEDVDPIDRTQRVPLSTARGRALATPVAADRSVPRAGIAAGEELVAADRRLTAADLAALKAAGRDEVPVRQRPTVAVVPVGEDLVQRDPGRDERVETTAFAVAEAVEGLDATVTYRNVVGEERPALRAAVQRDLTKDVVVLTGVGAGHPVGDVVAELGSLDVAGLAADPGGDLAVGTVEGRPVILVPPSAAAGVVAATRVVRPVLAALEGVDAGPLPSRPATLTAPVESPADRTTFVPVALSGDRATPLGEAGSDPDAGSDLDAAPSLGRLAAADGWIVVDPATEGEATGATVRVEDWSAG